MRLLLVDDDARILQVLGLCLEQEGHAVIQASNGPDALALAFEHRPDIVILDLMMPGMDGGTVCRHLRDYSDVPIIVLSALDDVTVLKDMLVQNGADDYIVKPVALAVLKAKLEALYRRINSSVSASQLVYDDGYLRIDLVEDRVWREGGEVGLAPKEAQVLHVLVENIGQVVTHSHLLEAAWGPGYRSETSYLALVIHGLRRKLERDAAVPEYVRTRHRVGYCFVACDPEGGDESA